MSSDSKALRRYHAGVERALGLFDATNEWADYIAFLSRLLKALQAAPQNADIPLKATLAKYLAQCLKPTLPSGVHQKALEVYSIIFTIQGPEGLSPDLPLYLPGLSHTLSFASLSTRPWFLALFEDHILKLSTGVVRPALKAIILSLLPGIEEENSEDFENALATFNKVRQMFAKDGSEEIFWQCLFLASITSPNKRTGVLVYLFRYFPKLGKAPSNSGEENVVAGFKTVTTPEPGLLVRCFATGLRDEQSLVQRGFLDLLVSHLPFHASTLQEAVKQTDLDILVSSAMSIVLRRDMGLNRRLWAWFTGSEEKSESSGPFSSTEIDSTIVNSVNGDDKPASAMNLTYFTRFGLASVVRCFEKMLLRKPPNAADRARPFRLLLSLMDRWTIGGPVVDAMFDSLLDDLQVYQTTAPSQGSFDEVFRSANAFFDGIEPRLVASHMFKLLKEGRLDLVEFIITNFNLEEEEMTKIHLPILILMLSERFSRNSEVGAVSPANAKAGSLQRRILGIMDELLELLPISTPKSSSPKQESHDSEDWIKEAAQFYASSPQHSKSKAGPLSLHFVEYKLLKNLGGAFLRCLEEGEDLILLDGLSSALEKTAARANTFSALKEINFVSQISIWALKPREPESTSFKTSRNVVSVIGSLQTFDIEQEALSKTQLLHIIPPLVERLWHCLSPSFPQYHVESVELIWTLRNLSSNLLLVESTIMSIMEGSSSSASERRSQMMNFGVFWIHTRLTDPVTTPTVSGKIPPSDNSPLSMLRAPMLHILDRADPGQKEDPYKLWMASLPSLGLFVQIALEESTKNSNELQSILPSLNRLHKLIAIARQTSTQWKDMIEVSGPLSPVLDWTTSLAVYNQSIDSWTTEALRIIRLVHEGAESPFNDTLIKTLTQQVSKTADGSDVQTQLLDTIQVLIALPKAGSPPLELLSILIAGISSKKIDSNIDKWITLLCNSIPLYPTSVFFSNLLKMTACFCKRTQAYFEFLKGLFAGLATEDVDSREDVEGRSCSPERSITNLFAGLEYILARAHTKATEQAQGSSDSHGPVAPEAPQSRSLANNRLTVILCMQDSIKVCGQVWFWRSLRSSTSSVSDTKSFNYMSSRLRNRSRRMLEHLIDAEPQECLETLMGMWVDAAKTTGNQNLVLNLLQTLDGARPKFMMPATFNAIYSRTNPSALDHAQRSSLSTDVSAVELMAFLVEYIDALEDDLLEEIWTDCTTFLRDVLANPMPQRHILLRMLEFVAILCKKMENTNFGEHSKMRRELADLCARLFTAIFTIKPGGFDSVTTEKPVTEIEITRKKIPRFDSGKGMEILCEALPLMNPVLNESDRGATVYSGISTNMTGPLLKSRAFPQNINKDVLILLQIMSKSPQVVKLWRKEISDAFNDQRFFQSAVSLTETGWMPLIKQLATIEKGVMPELISRLIPPSTAGLMFGVGAAAARTEADKRAQLNLRRIALLLLAADEDTFTINIPLLTTKIEELLTATPTSSPSSATRADIYLLLRAVMLSFSQLNLIALWPIIDAELRALFEDMTLHAESKLTSFSHVQGAKLLDLLLLLKPEEFQMHEWLFVTDTVDAIYPPILANTSSSPATAALADHMGSLSTDTAGGSGGGVELPAAQPNEARKPWLCTDASRDPKDYMRLLESFFRHLSIHAFEDTYSLEPVNVQAARQDLLADLFGDSE